MSWVSVQRAARLLNVTPRSVRRWAAKGEIGRKPGNNGYDYWVDEATVRDKRQESDPVEVTASHVGKMERALYIPDPHVPKNNPQVTELIFSFAKWWKPDKVFIIGDLIDFYTLSSFDQTPNYQYTAQDEIDLAGDFIQRVISVIPEESDIVWLLGNHEYRFTRYLKRCAPALYSLRALDLKELVIPFDDEIKVVPYNKGFMYRGRKVEHGDFTSQKSGYTAHRKLDRRRVPGVNGHTHRLGWVFYRGDRGVEDWCEIGCMQDLNPEYAKSTTNWQHGFAVSTWFPGLDVPKMQLVPIWDSGPSKVCFFGDKVFKDGE